MEVSKKAVLLKSSSGTDDKMDAYVEALQQIDVTAVCIPVLDFSFIHLDELWSSLCEPDRYSGIILTSPRAVQSVTQAIEHATRDDRTLWPSLLNSWKCKRTFVIGEATATAAEELGFITAGSDTGNAESLGPLIVKESKFNQSPLLFPCGNLRREAIPQHLEENNIPFHTIITYETIKHPSILKNISETCSDVPPDYMVFYSPSGVNFTLPVLKEISIDVHKIKCVAIGPTTSQSLENSLHGPPAAVARKPTPNEVKSAIMSILDD
ncbi:hypothetical protein LSH36_24g08000 [Paralvinella palmiformis]|uniref:Uroporphyrinogen-III synthase n=1 Tax=Paralvinella palmiformis TaxID=53620 RepID=A0AAD9K9X8_9ANNE|nr:hypothetical protein LSH36_24g08000 [Paralvinella palmiformis]